MGFVVGKAPRVQTDYPNTSVFSSISRRPGCQSVQRLTTGYTVRKSNPGGGETFHIGPDRPWGPPSLLYNGYRVSFPGVNRPGRGVNHPLPSNAEVKETVEQYM